MDTIFSSSKKTSSTLLQTFPFLPLQALRATKTWPWQSLHGLCLLAITCFSLRPSATSVFFLFLPEFQSSDILCFLQPTACYILWMFIFGFTCSEVEGIPDGFSFQVSGPKHHQLPEIMKCYFSRCSAFLCYCLLECLFSNCTHLSIRTPNTTLKISIFPS